MENKYLLKENVIELIDSIAQKMRGANVKPNEEDICNFITNDTYLKEINDYCNSTWSGDSISFDLDNLGIVYKDHFNINSTCLKEDEKNNIEYFNILYGDTHIDFDFLNEEKIVIEFSIFFEYSINGKGDRQPITIYKVQV